MSPSLKIVCHLCCISLTMLLPQLSLRYFFPFTFIYPRLSSILASFTVQIFPGAMGQALGWALREMRHRLCPSGSSRQAEKLSWKRRSRTPWSGARQEAGQRPRGAQRWEGWSLSTECSGRKASLRREPFLNVTIISAELKIRLHLPLFVNGSFESFLPSFPHFAGGAVRPTIRGLKDREDRVQSSPSQEELQGQTWSQSAPTPSTPLADPRPLCRLALPLRARALPSLVCIFLSLEPRSRPNYKQLHPGKQMQKRPSPAIYSGLRPKQNWASILTRTAL